METFGEALSSFYATYRSPILIVVIIVASIGLNWALRRLLKRMVAGIVSGVKRAQRDGSGSPRGPETGAPLDTQLLNARTVQRTRTLGTVGRHVISWTIISIAAVLILGQLHVNVATLITSAGIIAAGLAFGAQNIVKDILNGIFMVFEDQLGVGDVVTIGAISGTVEDVGIRVTQVRAIDGTLWFIRNGEILTLGNSSQGWGRAVIDVTVDANQDLSEVSQLSLDAARKLMSSDTFARKVTGEPEVLGLESVFGDRATLRLAVRTRPEAQWEVQRGIRAELRRTFREHNIRLADAQPKLPGGSA